MSVFDGVIEDIANGNINSAISGYQTLANCSYAIAEKEVLIVVEIFKIERIRRDHIGERKRHARKGNKTRSTKTHA